MKHVYVIAEAGVNHNGNVATAMKLCDAALAAGADAVKFQVFKAELSITGWADMAQYQKRNVGSGESQLEMVKKLELDHGAFTRIARYCKRIGLELLVTPDDGESLQFVLDLGLKKIKIGSCEVTNIPYLRRVGSSRKDIILSTGMSTMKEVGVSYRTLRASGARSVALLHCTTEYPCSPDAVNLQAMLSMRKVFGTEVGYSDHTLGIEAAIAAVGLGASIIEKHITLDKRMKGPDHAASLEPKDYGAMVKAIRVVERMLGDGSKKPSPSEKDNMSIARRSIVASRSIKKGERFTEVNITAKRPGTGISPSRWDTVIGRKAKKNFGKDELITI